jgi:hypothetical protein
VAGRALLHRRLPRSLHAYERVTTECRDLELGHDCIGCSGLSAVSTAAQARRRRISTAFFEEQRLIGALGRSSTIERRNAPLLLLTIAQAFPVGTVAPELDDDQQSHLCQGDCCSSPTIRKSAAPPRSNATACTANEPRCRCPGCRSARPLSDRWLSGKPLSVPVHQLVVGRHHQNLFRIARFLGRQPSIGQDRGGLSHR